MDLRQDTGHDEQDKFVRKKRPTVTKSHKYSMVYVMNKTVDIICYNNYLICNYIIKLRI